LDIIYQILSESVQFYRRYDNNVFGLFLLGHGVVVVVVVVVELQPEHR